MLLAAKQYGGKMVAKQRPTKGASEGQEAELLGRDLPVGGIRGWQS